MSRPNWFEQDHSDLDPIDLLEAAFMHEMKNRF